MKLPDRGVIQDVIDYAVARSGGFVELFFEESFSHTVTCEDGRVERISSGCDGGCGLRIVDGLRTVYGCSSRFDADELFSLATETTAGLEKSGGRGDSLGAQRRGATEGVLEAADLVSIERKTAVVLAADRAARSAGGEITQVQASCGDLLQRVGVFNSEGDAVEDERRQVLFTVRAVARGDGDVQTAYRSLGGRRGFELLGGGAPERLAAAAGEAAVTMLMARRAPAGMMTVVLGSGAGGTMTHEAIGHGLEGDTVEKGVSVYCGRIGESVASALITVVDDATLAGRRGSYVFDDEGIPAERTVCVENGILKRYLCDRRIARALGVASTGNGRRESYRFPPLVRMSNTFIAPGGHDPAEIVSSVREGLYVQRIGGGQVDTSSGDFVFKVEEAYLIRGGRVAEPVRGATLVGNGPTVLGRIDMVGSDLGFDIGTCGKDGQYVPVADAQPTLRIPSITVGGEV